jgi:hypothetical protein
MEFYRETLGVDVPLTEESQRWLRWKAFDTPPVALALRLGAAQPGDWAGGAGRTGGGRGTTAGMKILIDVGETPVWYEALIQDPDGNLPLMDQQKDGTAG